MAGLTAVTLHYFALQPDRVKRVTRAFICGYTRRDNTMQLPFPLYTIWAYASIILSSFHQLTILLLELVHTDSDFNQLKACDENRRYRIR